MHKKLFAHKLPFLLILLMGGLFLLFLFGGKSATFQSGERVVAVEGKGLTLQVQNGTALGVLDLVEGEEYIFDKIVLRVENADVTNSKEALNWLMNNSNFSSLDWTGVFESRVYWRRPKGMPPFFPDIFAYVYSGAAWIEANNTLTFEALDASGSVTSGPLSLSNEDFANSKRQQDYDGLRAEFWLENMAIPGDKTSAQGKRVIAQIVFAVQTKPQKLTIPSGAKTLRVTWDKKPDEPYDFPINIIEKPLGYGAHPKIVINDPKPVYMPGDTLSVTISILDDNGTPLSITDYASSGIGLIVNIINGPKQNYGFIGESVRINPGPMNPGPEPLFMSPPNLQPIPDPDKDTDDYTVTYEFKLPSDLNSDKYGAYTIVVEVDRVYGGEVTRNTAFLDFQVGTSDRTEISVRCPHCHHLEPMALGHLIPPMAGATKVEQCVACHTPEAAGGVIDFQRIIHSAHIRKTKTEGYLAAKNDCTVCHLTDESTDTVSSENCKYCHETFHSNNSPGYKEGECRSCHTDDSISHIDPKS